MKNKTQNEICCNHLEIGLRIFASYLLSLSVRVWMYGIFSWILNNFFSFLLFSLFFFFFFFFGKHPMWEWVCKLSIISLLNDHNLSNSKCMQYNSCSSPSYFTRFTNSTGSSFVLLNYFLKMDFVRVENINNCRKCLESVCENCLFY